MVQRGEAMKYNGRWWVGLLLLAGAMSGCGDDDHDHHHHDHHHHDHACVQVREVEPNDTTSTAQFLDPGPAGDCIIVDGQLAAATDVDTYRILIEESLTLTVTVNQNPGGDFAVQLVQADTGTPIKNCPSPVVPDSCRVSFDVHGRALPVHVVVTSVAGAGPYALTLDVQ
jgi:hypothetical protein